MPIVAPLMVHEDRRKALHMHQLLGHPSHFESPFTEQLGKLYQVRFGLELLDACVDIGQLVVVLLVVSDISGNAPIIRE